MYKLKTKICKAKCEFVIYILIPPHHQNVMWMRTGPNFKELLKHKIMLKQKNTCFEKSDYRPRLHSIVMLSKQQLTTSHKRNVYVMKCWPVKCVK